MDKFEGVLCGNVEVAVARIAYRRVHACMLWTRRLVKFRDGDEVVVVDNVVGSADAEA